MPAIRPPLQETPLSSRTRTTDLPGAELAPYTTAQLAFTRKAWPMRAAEELRSALIFRALARAARVVDMPAPWPSRLRAAIHDELRHARLCATVGAALGAEEPTYDPRPVRARLAALPEASVRAASLLLVEVAIGETISMCLFRAGRRAAAEPLTRAALESILGDEARHQRLGWSAFEALWTQLDPATRDGLQTEAARGLAGCERQTAVPAMQWLEQGRAFDPAYTALGVLHPEVRVETFYFAVERFVVPRLSRVGLDGPAAWKDRYRHPAQDHAL